MRASLARKSSASWPSVVFSRFSAGAAPARSTFSMVHDTALAPNSSSIFMRASWALALVPARASLSNSNSPRSLS